MAAHNMVGGAERLLAGIDGERLAIRWPRSSFRIRHPAGNTADRDRPQQELRILEVFTGIDLAIDKGSQVVVLGLNGAGKTTLRILAGLDEPDTGEVVAGHGLRIGYYAQEHETWISAARCWRI